MVKDTIAHPVHATPSARMAEKAQRAALGILGKKPTTPPRKGERQVIDSQAEDGQVKANAHTWLATVLTQFIPPRLTQAALGSATENQTFQQGKRETARRRYRQQNTSAKLNPSQGVAGCLRRMQSMVSGVTCKHVTGTSQAVYTGLQTCKSVWMCPCCAAAITEKRRTRELQPAVKKARKSDSGLRVAMVTLTFSHHANQPLKPLLGKLMKAHEAYQSGAQAARIKNRFGIIGTIRALECTYSKVNGFHPHLHLLVFMSKDANLADYERQARRKWELALASKGLSMNEHGFKVDDCDAHVADYVAKFGHDPSWDEAAELSKWHMKKGRGSALGDDEHVTPFGLLEYASQGDNQAAALFVEYCQAFKGRQQLKWSDGLKDYFGINEKTDEELMDEHDEQTDFEVYLPRESWAIILGNDCRYEFQAVVGMANQEEVKVFLSAIGIADYTIVQTE